MVILVSELEELQSKHTYVCSKLDELAKRKAGAGERISKLMIRREDAWRTLTEAEDALDKTTQEILFEVSPVYQRAYEQHAYFRAKSDIKNKQLEDQITLEGLFIAECENECQKAEEQNSDTSYWDNCRLAHIGRLNLLDEEKRRIDLYLEKSEATLYDIKNNAIFDMISKHKDNSEKRQLKMAGLEDANRAFNAAEGLLDEARKTLEAVIKEYDSTEAEAARLLNRINSLGAKSPA